MMLIGDEMARLEETARKVAEEAKQDKPTKLQFVRYVCVYMYVMCVVSVCVCALFSLDNRCYQAYHSLGKVYC